MSRARVLPLFYHVNAAGDGYEIVIGPPLDDYPGDDRILDAARMNAVLEEAVRAHPEQYFWVHRRFKTQPEGTPDPYPELGHNPVGRMPWHRNKRKKRAQARSRIDAA